MEEEHANEMLGRMAQHFSCLSCLDRLTILLKLSMHPDGMAVQELQEVMAIRQNTLSYHMNRLVKSGLVSERRVHRLKVYQLSWEANAYVFMAYAPRVS